jgi:hypothetical protein
MVVMMNDTVNHPPTPCLWQAPASTQNPKKEQTACTTTKKQGDMPPPEAHMAWQLVAEPPLSAEIGKGPKPAR